MLKYPSGRGGGGGGGEAVVSIRRMGTFLIYLTRVVGSLWYITA